MSEKHSPLPWSFENGCILAHDGTEIDENVSNIDAALIVRAVNNFDRLVETCGAVKVLLSEMGELDDQRNRQRANTAYELLYQALEEAKR